MRAIWTQLGKRKLEIVTVSLFIIFAVPWMAPMHFNTYELQMRLRMPFALGGLLSIPVFMCLLPFWWSRETPIDFEIMGITFSIYLITLLGLAVAYTIRKFVKRPIRDSHRWTVATIITVFALNFPCSACTLFATGSLYVSKSCETYFSKTRGIRVVTYTAIGFSDVQANTSFLLTTKDTGRSWQQKIDFENGVWEAELCRNTVTLDGTLVWTWSFRKLYRSNDGGDSWQTVSIPWEQNAYNQQVTFEDHQHAYITYDVYQGQSSMFRTGDGGKTWHKIAEASNEAG